MIPWIEPSFSKEEEDALMHTFRSGWITQGKEVAAFEDELKQYIGCKHVITVSNGTMALLMSYMLILDMLQTKKIKLFFPATSFIATIYPAMILGCNNFEFIDICGNFLMDANILRAKLFEAKEEGFTTVVVPVHLSGNAFNIDDIKPHCDYIIEDACQALGSSHENGVKVGSNSFIAAFSFHVGKIISTGEGGCIVTNDDDAYAKLVKIRNHGLAKDYATDFIGINGRMTDLQAAIGRVQLRKLDSFISYRKQLADYYIERVIDKSIFFGKPSTFVYSFMPVYIEDGAEKAKKFLSDRGVDARRFFPAFDAQHGIIHFELDNSMADKYREHVLLLPLGNGHTKEDIDAVINALNEYLTRANK